MSQKLKFERHFTTEGVHPFDQVEWKKVDAIILGADGKVKFELKGAEVPKFWSDRATKIVAEKYFRVCSGKKETSGKQMFMRVVRTIRNAGEARDYFASSRDATIFEDELLYILVNQMFAFNSPVWFNIGVPGVKQQASACFIQSVKDEMEDIARLATDEMLLFKGGSGTGSNVSSLRSSWENLSGGGEASGPVSFMGFYDAGAGVTKSGGTTRRAAKMVILNHDHPDILEQKNGRPGFITCKQVAEQLAHDLIDTGKYSGEFHIPGNAYELVGYQNANNSVRVTDEFMRNALDGLSYNTRKVTTGETVHEYNAKDVLLKVAHAAWFCGDPGMQYDSTINRWHTCKVSGRINGSNPCSEYMFLDDTACNLGSFNLMRFFDGKVFDVKGFLYANEICITAMEILVGYSSYPNERITKNSHRFRPLGIGYANLGALLMSMGLAYDSDEGREVAGAITSMMSGASYAQSARMADAVGAFEKFSENRDSMLEVIVMHSKAAYDLANRSSHRFGYLHDTSTLAWEMALDLGQAAGYRNSQISVLAPTGTISFLMDCDTTGGEPMTFLVAKKKLVGGGEMVMPNGAVVKALKNLGYSEDAIKSIEEVIAETGAFPAHLLNPGHEKVFQTAVGSDAISIAGHLRMMAAQQPFLSGAISKTVNMPEDATVEEVRDAYVTGWLLGLKAVAIYRDGCKRSQPLSDATKKNAATEVLGNMAKASAASECAGLHWGNRKRLPDERPSITHKFSVGGQEGYMTVGLYDDGNPAEIFLVISKGGSALHGFADMWATAMSLGLQHGVPLHAFIDKFRGMQFMPSGFTEHKNIRMALSLGDYLARWLDQKFYAPVEEEGEAPAHEDPVVQKVAAVKKKGISYDGPPCTACGGLTQRNGGCYVCTVCGTNTGCG